MITTKHEQEPRYKSGTLTYNFHKLFQPSAIGEKQRAHGIDTSHWSGRVDTANVSPPLDFLITKLTEGIYYRDTGVDQIWDGSINVPVRGLYHYQRSGQSWQAQSEFFLANAQPFTDCKIFVLDYEPYGNDVNSSSFKSDVKRIISDWRQKRPDVKVLLYTNKDMLQNYLYPFYIANNDQFFLDQTELFYAQYFYNPNPDGIPVLPYQRDQNNWTFWQYTEAGDGSKYGVEENAVDLDVFNGGVTELYNWAELVTIPEPPIPPEPPIGEIMYKGRIKTGTNIRTSYPAQNGSYLDIGDLALNDIVYADIIHDSNGTPWWHLIDATRNGQPILTTSGVSVKDRSDTYCYGVNVTDIEEITDPGIPTDPTVPGISRAVIDFHDDHTLTGTWE